MSLEWTRARALEHIARLHGLVKSRYWKSRAAFAVTAPGLMSIRSEAANADRFAPEKDADRSGPNQRVLTGSD
jgi:hypothetical protein